MTQLVGAFSRPGPEAGLLSRFMAHSLPTPQPGEQRSVFIEPDVESRRPDLVAVYWRLARTRDWPEARMSLTRDDLRLVHYLHASGGPLSRQVLAVRFPRRLDASVRRLVQAKVVREVGDSVRLRAFSSVFATTRIISVEAKMSSLDRALSQAHLNTVFSSESYVVNPTKRPTPRLAERAKSYGVGMWGLHEELDLHAAPRTHSLPRSYMSWVLNDLAWRGFQQSMR